ncbi:MAG: hypothetical protein NZL89_06485 [Leptospiraceae bacterium]|nr:hypothetical protein [Leptospiraceae bacterium]
MRSFVGYLLLGAISLLLRPLLLRHFSVVLSVFPLTANEWFFAMTLLVLAFAVALLPAYLLYRRALSERLSG